METGSTDEQSVLVFEFDTAGKRTGDSDDGSPAPLDSSGTEGNSNASAARPQKKNNRCSKRCSCHTCVICLAVSLVLVILAMGTLVLVVSLNLNFNLPNATQVEDESEFFDTWVAPEEVKENARSYLGTDKNNLTIWFMDSGRWNWDELLKTNSSKKDLDNYVDQHIYQIRKSFKRTKNNHDGPEANGTGKWVLMSNMDGYSLAQSFNFKATAYMQEMLGRHLPTFKQLDYAFVINMHSWSRFLAGIMAPILGDTMDKFQFHGYEDWLPLVLDRIDAKELPEGYGAYLSDDNDDNWF